MEHGNTIPSIYFESLVQIIVPLFRQSMRRRRLQADTTDENSRK